MAPNRLRIALISEHASPLARAGSVDAGGRNVYVAHVARSLAAPGLVRREHQREADPWAAAPCERLRPEDARSMNRPSEPRVTRGGTAVWRGSGAPFAA